LELGRLQNITLLFLQTLPELSVSKKNQIFIKETILNWINANPFLLGPHYISPMELGLRIPLFFYCLKLVKQLSDIEKIRIVATIYQHTWWISKNLALYSSLGNHTICEAIGLIFGGAIFQRAKQGNSWLQQVCKLLESELFHQFLNDGGSAEQSLNYHRFVLDLYWLAIDFLETNKIYDCIKWRKRLNAGEIFWSAFQYDGENIPSIGDSDDGYAIAPGISLSGELSPESWSDSNRRISHRTFPEAGYTIIKTSDELFITFDHGPLGMPPLYNHGHADALSINLYKNQKPFFIDIGTYKYNGVPEKRAYFKGTRAHNTICIDGMDQARQLTGFIWDKPYKVKWDILKDTEEFFHIKASHDGYLRLKKPAIHIRDFQINDDQTCIIIDSFQGEEEVHLFELNFHLHPNVKISDKNGWLMLENGNESIYISNFKSDFSKIKGQSAPLLGWYSPGYGLIEKTTTLHIDKRGTPASTFFITVICMNADNLQKAETLFSKLDIN